MIAYETSRVEAIVNDADLVFDIIGAEILNRSWSVLKPGGRLLAIDADAEG